MAKRVIIVSPDGDKPFKEISTPVSTEQAALIAATAKVLGLSATVVNAK